MDALNFQQRLEEAATSIQQKWKSLKQTETSEDDIEKSEDTEECTEESSEKEKEDDEDDEDGEDFLTQFVFAMWAFGNWVFKMLSICIDNSSDSGGEAMNVDGITQSMPVPQPPAIAPPTIAPPAFAPPP